ncbi:MAG: LytTR family DNA-binding domain-containing protein [Proteocatella sp.]
MINIAICDDKPEDRDTIKTYICDYFDNNPHNYKITEFEKGENLAAEYMDESACFDLIFMDIFMVGENGIATARNIRKYSQKVKIIFMSTSSEFALESYDVFAYGYLLKPVDHDKIRILLDKYLDDAEENEKRLMLNIKGKINHIRYADIVYLESKNTAIIIHTNNDEEFKIYGKLDDIEESLNNRRFLRCHQSYIINMDYVSSVDKEFQTKTNKRVLIRKRSLKDMKDRYYKYIIAKMES